MSILPGVTVIIPHFERVEFLEETLASIPASDPVVNEIVVVDDGSSRQTVERVRRVVSTDSRASLVRHRKNLGGSAARNTAVQEASNSWIFCLDSDNLLTPMLVQQLLEGALNGGLDIAVPERTVFFNKDPRRPTHAWFYLDRPVDLLDHVVSHMVPSASGNYLFSKDSWQVTGGYQIGVGPLDAWLFGFMQVAAGLRMQPVPSTQYLHRYGHDSYWIRGQVNGKLLRSIALQVVTNHGKSLPTAVRLQLHLQKVAPWSKRLPIIPQVWAWGHSGIGSLEVYD